MEPRFLTAEPRWFSNQLKGFILLESDPEAGVPNMGLNHSLPREDL